MWYQLFHQNMRNYSGGAGDKSFRLDYQFKQICGRNNDFMCAGFTELRNASDAMVKQVLYLGQCLHPKMDSANVIPAGISGGSITEYVGAAWDSTRFKVEAVGYFAYRFVDRQYICYATKNVKLQDYGYPSAEILADYRSPIFLYGKCNGTSILVMFMHNMYKMGDRSAAFNSINEAIAGVRAYVKMQGWADIAAIYVGGDFNLPPEVPKHNTELKAIAPLKAGVTDKDDKYEHTTNANCYDWWLTSDAKLTELNAQVWGQTREPIAADKNMYTSGSATAAKAPSEGVSDHAGISLILNHMKSI